ncbi:MAG: membrane protein of unknown function [Candidatus Thorarchaeota archaeon]|nr:MAG: membrane protein of unknown function [Candidatus Thorarchaeota archaeon]
MEKDSHVGAFHYIALILGILTLTIYAWWIFSVGSWVLNFMETLFIAAGISMIPITLLIGKSDTRSGRVLFTIISAALGGVHGYLVLAFFPTTGAMMFLLFGFGLLMTAASITWIQKG